ncbi:MAG: bifunctional glutamate N-acetyltransferase/amino-acid acetyltransferase ArgJ [Acidobacteria bacterium]|nr:bifunctional glutamate N-acetyltransferase/amino-acid acetyltransferase ArgJ [Acidobacteriota bacterium]
MADRRDVTVTPIRGGVATPEGFRTSALHCGVKANATALDLVVLAADVPASAAAIFTTNLAQAAPVIVSREHLESSRGVISAIIVNSGCANACTGPEGHAHARTMASETAQAIGCASRDVLVASTGVIGVALPIDRIVAGIRAAVPGLARSHGGDAARAIMTTDISPKECAVTVTTPRGAFTIGGMAKGAGMIEPNMATMLGFLTTDAAVSPALLQKALDASARDTFNAITVDGECSTNDSLFALASGASGVSIDEATYPALVEGLLAVSRELALAIVRGGEGATKLVAVTVSDAQTVDAARQVARTIANSPLVKTAVHGADPNWGRIVSATGRSGVTFDLANISVRIGGVLLFDHGTAHDERAPQAAEHLRSDTIQIDVSLGSGGPATATIWTCDLSAEYVRINGEYRT